MTSDYKYFRYYQPNEKDKKDTYGDCVIRALTKALNKSWYEVFDDLVPLARELQCMPNSKPAFEKYLLDNDFKYGVINVKKGSKRPTVESFTKEHKKGTYILRVAHHVVASVDGLYYDTGKCGHKSLYGYWYKEGVDKND